VTGIKPGADGTLGAASATTTGAAAFSVSMESGGASGVTGIKRVSACPSAIAATGGFATGKVTCAIGGIVNVGKVKGVLGGDANVRFGNCGKERGGTESGV